MTAITLLLFRIMLRICWALDFLLVLFVIGVWRASMALLLSLLLVSG